MVERGEAPIHEPGWTIFNAKRIDATTDLAAAVREADLTLICVGTPSRLRREHRPLVRRARRQPDRGSASGADPLPRRGGEEHCRAREH